MSSILPDSALDLVLLAAFAPDDGLAAELGAEVPGQFGAVGVPNPLIICGVLPIKYPFQASFVHLLCRCGYPQF